MSSYGQGDASRADLPCGAQSVSLVLVVLVVPATSPSTECAELAIELEVATIWGENEWKNDTLTSLFAAP